MTFKYKYNVNSTKGLYHTITTLFSVLGIGLLAYWSWRLINRFLGHIILIGPLSEFILFIFNHPITRWIYWAIVVILPILMYFGTTKWEFSSIEVGRQKLSLELWSFEFEKEGTSRTPRIVVSDDTITVYHGNSVEKQLKNVSEILSQHQIELFKNAARQAGYLSPSISDHTSEERSTRSGQTQHPSRTKGVLPHRKLRPGTVALNFQKQFVRTTTVNFGGGGEPSSSLNQQNGFPILSKAQADYFAKGIVDYFAQVNAMIVREPTEMEKLEKMKWKSFSGNRDFDSRDYLEYYLAFETNPNKSMVVISLEYIKPRLRVQGYPTGTFKLAFNSARRGPMGLSEQHNTDVAFTFPADLLSKIPDEYRDHLSVVVINIKLQDFTPKMVDLDNIDFIKFHDQDHMAQISQKYPNIRPLADLRSNIF